MDTKPFKVGDRIKYIKPADNTFPPPHITLNSVHKIREVRLSNPIKATRYYVEKLNEVYDYLLHEEVEKAGFCIENA